MKTQSKHSKVQGRETKTFPQGFYSMGAKESMDRTSSPSTSIKYGAYLYQKTFSRSSAKPYSTQTYTPKTGEEAWLLKSTRKLQELENLPANWDSYGANPPNSIALFWGREALTVLFEMNFPPTQITPSVEEGVGICFIRGKKYADIECFNTGEILAVTSDGQGNPNVWEVNPSREELKNSLQRIRVYLQS